MIVLLWVGEWVDSCLCCVVLCCVELQRRVRDVIDRLRSIDRSIKTAAYPPHHMGSPRFCFFNTNNKQPLKLAVKPVGTPAKCDAGWACAYNQENATTGSQEQLVAPPIPASKRRGGGGYFIYSASPALFLILSTLNRHRMCSSSVLGLFGGSISPVTRLPVRLAECEWDELSVKQPGGSSMIGSRRFYSVRNRCHCGRETRRGEPDVALLALALPSARRAGV